MGKTPSSHIIHSLGGEYCWIVRDSEPIRLLKSPRSLSVYILIKYVKMNDEYMNFIYLNHIYIWTMEWWGEVNARRSSQLKMQLMQMRNPDLCDTSALLLIISSSSFVGTCILWSNLMTSSPLAYRVVESSRLLAKIAAYLVSIGRLLCLAFLYGWRFLNKISLDWPRTLITQPSTSKLSDNPKLTSSIG